MISKSGQQRRYIKALETLVFLANKDHRQYWILKSIYLADKEHLSQYGRQLFDDRYIAMKWGPVPSLAYDIVKSVRQENEGSYIFPDPIPSTALSAPDNRTIEPKRKSRQEYLSASEIKCLNAAYDIVKGMSFAQLHEFSQDGAYKAVEQDEDMSFQKIVETLKNSKEVLEYVYAG